MTKIDELTRVPAGDDAPSLENWRVGNHGTTARLHVLGLVASALTGAGTAIETALDTLVAPFAAASRGELTATIRALLAHDPYLLVLVARAR